MTQDSQGKRRPTERLGSQVDGPLSAAPNDDTRAMPAFEPGKEAPPGTLAAMDAASKRHDSEVRLDPSEPNGVVGPVTKRHRKTSPYMSSSPNLPMKPKKSLPRRILKWVGWSLVGLLVLILLAVGFFHTGPGKEVARGIVEGALAKRFDGDVTLAELDYALFGDLELKGLKVAEKGGGRTVIHLEHALVDLDWGSLLSKPLTIEKLMVDGLTLDLVAFPDGTSNLKRMQKEQSKLPDSLVLQDISVKRVNVSIEREDAGGKVITRIADLALEANASLDGANKKTAAEVKRLALTFGLERAGLSVSMPVAATMSAKMDGDDAKLSLVAEPSTATVVRGDKTLSVPVTLGAVEAALAGRDLSFGLSRTVLGPLAIERVGAKAKLPEGGAFDGEVLVELVGGKLDHAAVNGLLGRELLAGDIDLGLSIKGPPKALVLAGDVSTPGGKLALTGEADVSKPLEPVYRVVLTGTDLDTALLVKEPLPQSLRSAFTLTISGQGLPPTGEAKLELNVDKTVVTQATPEGNVVRTLDGMSLVATSKGPVIDVEGLVVKAFGQTLTFDGGVDRETLEVRGTLRMTSRLEQAIANAREAGVLITPLPPIEGELDVDLGMSAKLKPLEVIREMAKAPLQLTALPVETLKIKGTIRGTEVKAMDRQVGSLSVDVDVTADERGPESIQGRLAARVGNLDAGTLHLDGVDLEVLLEGFTQKIALAVRDERQKLDAQVAIQSVLDLQNRKVKATFEKVELERGQLKTKLVREVTIDIDQPAGGEQKLNVPPIVLSLAGGTVSLASKVDLVPDPDKPGANKVERFDVNVDLDGVDIQRLAALAGRSTQGLSGRFSGTMRAQGRPDDPQVEMVGTLRGRMKGGAPTTTKLDVTLRDKVLDARVAVADTKNKPVLELDVRAPITLPPPGSGQKPGLAPGGRLSVEAELFETTLSRLAELAPNPALAQLDPDAKVSGKLALNGTTSRPSGTWSLSFSGDILRRRGYAEAPAMQRLEVVGTMGPEERATGITNTLSLWLDGRASPYVVHTTRARLDRSPLLRDPLGATWTVTAGLDQAIDLAKLADIGLAKMPLAGALTSEVALSGKGQDVLGTMGFAVRGARVGAAPPADFVATTQIADDHIATRQVVTVAGLEALVSDARIGVGGRGLRALVKQRDRLMKAPLSGEVRVVEHSLAEWKTALGELGKRLPALPGNVGGALVLSGTVAVPLADGSFAWDGYQTASGKDGRMALAIAATPDTLGGGLELGPARDVKLGATVARSALSSLAPTAPLPVDLAMKADKVDLKDLVPAFALTSNTVAAPGADAKAGAARGANSDVGAALRGRPAGGTSLDFRGNLDWAMAGRVLLERDPVKKVLAPLAPGSGLTGHMTIDGLDLAVPDTDRHFRDGVMKVVATADALKLEGLYVREADIQRDDRTFEMAATVPWTDLRPSAVALKVKTHEFLVLGLGFDGPEGELDLNLDVAVTDLDKPVKAVAVTVNAMQLNAPDRFIRAHYPQFPAYDDLIYVSAEQASGKLPVKTKALAPATTSAVGPAPAESGFDVKLRIPEPIHVIFAAASPIEIKLKGGMDVAMRGASLDLQGRLDVTEGLLGAMGREFHLVKGAITAGGGIETAQAELVFAATPTEIALRDVARGDHDNKATITIFASAKTGMRTIFGGVSGPYLLDMATFLNTGRGRLWGEPDAPTSEILRFGNPDQGLVNTFVQTNLRNLVFMDRSNGWSTSQEDPSQYGRLRHFDMQRFLPAENRSRRPGQRVRFSAQPLEPGVGPFTFGYDWLLVSDPRAVFGFGPFLDFDLRAGLGFTLEWSSEQ